MANITKRGNSYLIRCSAGYTLDGKQIFKSSTFKPALGLTPKQEEKALNEAVVLFEKRVKTGQVLDGKIRFADFADKWIADYGEEHLAPKTLTRYKEILPMINNAIGNIQLEKLQPHHFLEYYKFLGKTKSKRTGRKYSDSTIYFHHRIISTILSTALKWQVIFDNPIRRIAPPKIAHKEAKYLDVEQVKAFINALDSQDIKYKTAFVLSIYSGFRRGELLGLKWADVDWENKEITMSKTIQYLPDRGIFEKEPKTYSSNRKIALPPTVMSLLKEYQTYQKAERLKVGDRWQDKDYIFTQWDGSPMHPDTLSGRFKSIAKKLNFPKGTTLHSLRHTSATLLISSHEIDIKAISSRLGHSKTSTTMNIYAHALQSADKQSANVLESIIAL